MSAPVDRILSGQDRYVIHTIQAQGALGNASLEALQAACADHFSPADLETKLGALFGRGLVEITGGHWAVTPDGMTAAFVQEQIHYGG